MLNKLNFKVGHYKTGYAPSSRELELLKPDKTVNVVNAVLLTGCSAFGLIRAEGVVKFLKENNIGYKTPYCSICCYI